MHTCIFIIIGSVIIFSEVSHIHANTGFTFQFISIDTHMRVRQGETASKHIDKGNERKRDGHFARYSIHMNQQLQFMNQHESHEQHWHLLLHFRSILC